MDWLGWRSDTFIIHAAVIFNDLTNDPHPRQTYNQFKPWEQTITLLGCLWSSMLFRVKGRCNHAQTLWSALLICEIMNIFCLSRYTQKWRELAWRGRQWRRNSGCWETGSERVNRAAIITCPLCWEWRADSRRGTENLVSSVEVITPLLSWAAGSLERWAVGGHRPERPLHNTTSLTFLSLEN